MRVLLLLLGSLLAFIAQAADPGTPAALDSWRTWVAKDQGFRACPMIVTMTSGSGSGGVSATEKSDFICQWPGTLNIVADGKGATIAQHWIVEADGWVPLPGSREHWPQEVLVDGRAAAVVDFEGPTLWLAKGDHDLRARFFWTERPQSLRVPASVALITLSVDGKPIRPLQLEGVSEHSTALTLGRGATSAVEADSFELHVYRKFADGVPGRLTTEIRISASGQAREEVFGPVLPAGFVPMFLESAGGDPAWASRLDDDGRLHVQVQPGRTFLRLEARALAPVATLSAVSPERWVDRNWSYESSPAFRVTSISGAVQVDPRQADVPGSWIQLPAYALGNGNTLTIEERSRGIIAAEANRLVLQREAWLDFSGDGWFGRDHITGEMKRRRFDLAAPYQLQRAQSNVESGEDGLLITRGAGPGFSGVEWHAPKVDLRAGVRIDQSSGAIPVSGWQQVFDQVITTLHLPYGYRLVAAPGADRASGSWLSGWTLLDVFLAAILVLLASRLLGWVGAALAAAYLLLGYQENGAPVWTLLVVLAMTLIVRALPSGRLLRFARGLRVLAVTVLLFVAVPFCAGQLRQAIHPQLEHTQGAFMEGFGSASKVAMRAEPAQGGTMDDMPASMAPPPPPPAPLEEMRSRSSAPTSERLDTVVVTGSAVRPAQLISKYSQSTVVQTGAGEPGWHFGNSYTLNWSGPVLADQQVNLVIARPWLVRALRVLLVALLGVLLWRIAQGMPWRRPSVASGSLAGFALLCTSLMCAPVARAADYPSDALLQQLHARVLEAPPCIPNCASIALVEVTASGDELRVNLEIHALARVAVPVPTDERRCRCAVSRSMAGPATRWRVSTNRGSRSTLACIGSNSYM